MRIIIFLSLWLASGSLHAAVIEKVEFPDSITVEGQKLVLNGVGLRTKRKFGLNFKVYVAALWLPKMTNVADEAMAPGMKVVELVFLRSLDKDTMQEAWTDSFKNNCRSECEDGLKKMQAFYDILTDVKSQHRLKLIFDKSGVNVDLNGQKMSTGRVEGAEFTRNLMAAFIGPKPPSEDLKKGLLGPVAE